MADPAEGDFLSGFDSDEFAHDGITRDIFRARKPGPPVILLHEAGGLNALTVGVANRMIEAGLRPVLPVLIDIPRRKPSAVQLARNMWAIFCIVREFRAVAENQPTPISNWLRALARHEHQRAGGPGVGVVGMCFSGGFALATVTEPAVLAAVASQPGLPFPRPGRRADLAISSDELDDIAVRAEAGFCVRTLRYQRDVKSPGARMRYIEELFPNASVVEIPSWNPNKHSVLADAASADRGTELGRALTGTVSYLVQRLAPTL